MLEDNAETLWGHHDESGCREECDGGAREVRFLPLPMEDCFEIPWLGNL